MALGVLTLASAVALSASPVKLAILDIQSRPGTSDALAKSLTDAAVAAVRDQLGAAAVIGSDDIRQMARYVAQKQLLGCSQMSCFAEIGGALGVDRILTGTLGKVGSKYILVFKLIDVRRAVVLAEGSSEVVEDQLLPGMRSALRPILGVLMPAAPTAAVTPPSVAVEKPQAGRSHTLGIALGVVAVAAATFTVIGIYEYASLPNAATWAKNNPGQTLTTTIAQGEVTTANSWGWVAVATGVAALGSGTGAVIAW